VELVEKGFLSWPTFSCRGRRKRLDSNRFEWRGDGRNDTIVFVEMVVFTKLAWIENDTDTMEIEGY